MKLSKKNVDKAVNKLFGGVPALVSTTLKNG